MTEEYFAILNFDTQIRTDTRNRYIQDNLNMFSSIYIKKKNNQTKNKKTKNQKTNTRHVH